jgi:hypothetical protein
MVSDYQPCQFTVVRHFIDLFPHLSLDLCSELTRMIAPEDFVTFITVKGVPTYRRTFNLFGSFQTPAIKILSRCRQVLRKYKC